MRESSECTDKQPLCWQVMAMNSEALEFVISFSISKGNNCHPSGSQIPAPFPMA